MSKDASGQVDPKKTNSEKRVKRGRLHFTEEEVTRQAGEQASGQVGPKSQSTGKFRQDGEREKPSSRLRKEGEAREDTVCEEQAARKDQKDKREKRKNGPKPRRNIPLSGWKWQRKSYPVRSRRSRPAFPSRRSWWRGLVCGPMDTAKSMRSNTKMLVWKEPTRPSFWRRPGRIRSAAMPSGVSGSIQPVRLGSGNGEQ